MFVRYENQCELGKISALEVVAQWSARLSDGQGLGYNSSSVLFNDLGFLIATVVFLKYKPRLYNLASACFLEEQATHVDTREFFKILIQRKLINVAAELIGLTLLSARAYIFNLIYFIQKL